MKKRKTEKLILIDSFLEEIPKMSGLYRGQRVISIKKIPSGNKLVSDTYKVVTRRTDGLKKHYFVKVVNKQENFLKEFIDFPDKLNKSF